MKKRKDEAELWKIAKVGAEEIVDFPNSILLMPVV